MKIRALGTGNLFCRWPLIPSCWLIQTHNSNVLIGCPTQAPARLEGMGIELNKIEMVIPLGTSTADIGGLDEFGAAFTASKNKPYLAGPEKLIERVAARTTYIDGFQKKSAKKIGINEEHITETITFIPNQNGTYGFRMEFAKIYCSGPAPVSEETLSKQTDCDAILHEDGPALPYLPVYIQNKIWLYGYKAPAEGADPLPMLYLPQGAFFFDSDRRDKLMAKERYIRENSKRLVGNESSK